MTTVAPAGLFSIFGTNLSRVTTGLDGGTGTTVPTSLNGVSVTVGGTPAAILYTSPGQINAQVPVNAVAGSQPVIVTVGGTAGAASNIPVAAVAPAIFVYTGGGIAVQSPSFALITTANPARAADVILIYATGLGQTTPPMTTGGLVVFPPASNTAAISVTIGGRDAELISSIASPTFVGLYQVAVRVPAGIPAGPAAVVLRMGTTSSNNPTIPVQ